MRPVYEEFDIAEMSLSWYMMARCRNEPVIALPIFPLRMQIHPYIFCGTASGIERPEDLQGKKIGMDEYRLTVGLWARGILREYTACSRKTASHVAPERAVHQRLRASTSGCGQAAVSSCAANDALIPLNITIVTARSAYSPDLRRPVVNIPRLKSFRSPRVVGNAFVGTPGAPGP
jgi:hypothetical protein